MEVSCVRMILKTKGGVETPPSFDCLPKISRLNQTPIGYK